MLLATLVGGLLPLLGVVPAAHQGAQVGPKAYIGFVVATLIGGVLCIFFPQYLLRPPHCS